jgi:hypothetical protein
MEHYCGYYVIAAPGTHPKRWRFGAQSLMLRFCMSAARGYKLAAAWIVMALIAAVAASPAAAQEFIAGGPYAVAALPGFDAPGITSGDFTLSSRVSFGVAYDSNILRTSTPAQDYIFFVAPSFDLARNGSDHIENVFASVSSARYAQSDADNFNNAVVRASETYLLSPTSQILIMGAFTDGYERRTSSNHDIPTDAAAPIHGQTMLASAGYTKTWNGFAAGVTVTAGRNTYDDVRSTGGALLDQTFRDETDLSVMSFLSIPLTGRIRSDVAFSATHSEVREQDRDSDQWRFSDNTNIELTSKTSAGFLVAVREQDYYNNPLIAVTPLAEYEGLLRWSPIQRMTLIARGGYHDLGVNYTTGILGGGGAGRYGSLDLSYLIRRDLQLLSSFSYEKMVAGGNQGNQNALSGRAVINYELSSYAGISFLYTYQRLDATSAQFTSYDENIVQTSLNLRF